MTLYEQQTLSIIGSVLSTLIVTAIVYFFQPKARLQVIDLHRNFFMVTVSATGVAVALKTQTWLIRNSGRKNAHNVRIGHAITPQCFTVFPAISYRTFQNPAGNHFIEIDSMPPKFQISVEVLTEHDLPVFTGLTFEGGTGKHRHFTINPILSKPVALMVVSIFFIGVLGIFYVAIRLGLSFFS